jgi:hypothetical protein
MFALYKEVTFYMFLRHNVPLSENSIKIDSLSPLKNQGGSLWRTVVMELSKRL